MKLTLEFNLPEEMAEMNRCLEGPAAFDALEEIYRLCRNTRKYGGSTDMLIDEVMKLAGAQLDNLD